MLSATKPRNARTFRSGDYIANLMAEISKAAVTQRIAEKREETGLTQQEVADLMNVTARTVQYWESRTQPIVAFDRLDELARVIGTTKFWLLHGAELPGSAEDAASLAEILGRLQSLEGTVAESMALSREMLQLLREIALPTAAAPPVRKRASGK